MTSLKPRPPTQLPRLPPGFEARAVAGDPRGAAIDAAAGGADPAIVFHAPLTDRCDAAVTLAPEMQLSALPILRLGALALHDALAVDAPIHIPIRIASPSEIHVNGAVAATLSLDAPTTDPGAIPDWAVLGLRVAVDLRDPAPGATPDVTCLVEEGWTADGLATAMLEGFCRHLLTWLDVWREDGELGLVAAWRAATAVSTPVAS